MQQEEYEPSRTEQEKQVFHFNKLHCIFVVFFFFLNQIYI